MEIVKDYVPAAFAESKGLRCAAIPAPEFYSDGKPQYVMRGILFILSGRRRGMYWTPFAEMLPSKKSYLWHAHQVADEQFGARTRYVQINVSARPSALIDAKGKHVSDEEAQQCLSQAEKLMADFQNK